MRAGRLCSSIGLTAALAVAACGDEVAAPADGSSFTAEVTGDFHRQMSGVATVTDHLEVAEDLTDADGRELTVLILQDGAGSSGGTNIFFGRQGTELAVGEYALGDSYLGPEGERKVLATFNEWLADGRTRHHYASEGVLRITESGLTGVSGTFEVRVGEWVILDPSKATENAAEVPSGSSDLRITGTFSALRR